MARRKAKYSYRPPKKGNKLTRKYRGKRFVGYVKK